MAAPTSSALIGIFDPRRDLGHSILPALGRDLLAPGRAVVDGAMIAGRQSLEVRPASRAGDVWCLLEGTVDNIAELADDVGLVVNAEPQAVIAHAYRRKGAAMLDDLRGAFALVAWNGDEQAGIVAVDQLGVRAVYFVETGGTLSFSTEIHTLLRLLPRRPAPVPVAVIHTVSGSPLPEDMTLYQGVRRLGGGNFLDLNRQWTKRRYWVPRYRPPQGRTLSECADEIGDAVAAAVRTRTDVRERVGIIMSGGIDSAAVASAAARGVEKGLPMPCGYSAVFPHDPEIDESERIDLLTAHLGLPSVQIEPEPIGALWLSFEYLRRWELPLSGPGYVIEYPLLRESRRGRHRCVDRRPGRRRSVRASRVPSRRSGAANEVRCEHSDGASVPGCGQPAALEAGVARLLGALRTSRRRPTPPSSGDSPSPRRGPIRTDVALCTECPGASRHKRSVGLEKRDGGAALVEAPLLPSDDLSGGRGASRLLARTALPRAVSKQDLPSSTSSSWSWL